MTGFWLLDELECLGTDKLPDHPMCQPEAESLLEAVRSVPEAEHGAVLDAQKLSYLIGRGVSDPHILFRNAAFRLQGTDGIRGIFSDEDTSGLEAVRRFIAERKLTPGLAEIYVRSVVNLLDEAGTGYDTTVLLGEDGRDMYLGGTLKKVVMKGIREAGWSVLDMGTLPTPVLVYESVRYALPAVMLTASHNPAEYNGIKLFAGGSKLYPEGRIGEYALTARIFSEAAAGHKVGMEGHAAAIDAARPLCDFLDSVLDKDLLRSILTGRRIYLDAANGAYSASAASYLSALGAEVIPCACSPGKGMINAGCGVGNIENLPPFPDLQMEMPAVLWEMAEDNGDGKEPFGIVLDGDGDRAFLVRKENGRLHILDGDFLASSICRLLSDNGRSGLFVCTVESDPALLESIRSMGWDTEMVCVGDRWLPEARRRLGGKERAFIGAERSGHAIIPAPAGEHEVLSGNGLLTALLALEKIALTEPGWRPFEPGTIKRAVWRNVPMEGFFRSSDSWNRTKEAILNECPFACSEREMPQEMDMMFFTLSTGNGTGNMFMRRSGTEPKITLTAAVPEADGDEAEAFLGRIEGVIGEILR